MFDSRDEEGLRVRGGRTRGYVSYTVPSEPRQQRYLTQMRRMSLHQLVGNGRALKVSQLWMHH